MGEYAEERPQFPLTYRCAANPERYTPGNETYVEPSIYRVVVLGE